MKRSSALLLLAVLGACAPSTPAPLSPRAAPAVSVPPPSRHATPTPYVQARPSDQPPPSSNAQDACGAGAHAYLVGKKRSEIPVPVNPSQRRVYCSSCPVTMDYSPWRLNIVYDQNSGVITEVKCG